MLKSEYKAIYNMEESYWWYVCLHALLLNLIKYYMKKFDSANSILDVGCGTGSIMNKISLSFPIWNVVGLDLSNEALHFCRKRNKKNVLQGSASKLPFSSNSFEMVLSSDVLYHLWIKDDIEAISEIYRVLKKEGIFILHLPAFEFLRGSHDEVVFTRERYTAKKLRNKLTNSGFNIIKLGYRNTFIFPLIIFKRLKSKRIGSNKIETDLKQLHPSLNSVLTFIGKIENKLSLKFNMPFGSSVFCVCVKI